MRRTKAQLARELGEHISGRRRRLISVGMGDNFTLQQARAVEQACQRWIDAWVLDSIGDLLPRGPVRDAFLAAATNRTVPDDIARYDATRTVQS